jgi:hypothetical protein
MSGGRFPDFVIIGAMKSATSTLHSQLEAQPGFCMSTPKEPNFFSDADQWAKGLDWYKGLFAGAAPGDLCGESSTHYTKLPDLPDALPRLAAHVPDAKLIYVMRHPVDRLVSHYIHGWSERTIDGPIDDAVEHHPALIDYGCYAMQIQPWIDRFGKERILPLFFERLLKHPQAELERVCRFLGYDGRPEWQDGVRDNVSAQRLRTSPLRDAIVGNPLVTLIRRNLIPQSVRDRIKGRWQMREKPVLGDAARARVTAAFDADLAKLGDLLGTRIDCANFKTQVVERPLDWA